MVAFSVVVNLSYL